MSHKVLMNGKKFIKMTQTDLDIFQANISNNVRKKIQRNKTRSSTDHKIL